MKFKAFIAAILLVLATATAQADEPRFGQTAFALEGSSSPQTSFTPDTPKIVLHVQLLEVPAGAKIASDWIAVQAAGAPENYRIDGVTVDATGENEAEFSLSKPDAGWPVGSYRVDLSINGKKLQSPEFKIAP
jgi:hypothetical protein